MSEKEYSTDNVQKFVEYTTDLCLLQLKLLHQRNTLHGLIAKLSYPLPFYYKKMNQMKISKKTFLYFSIIINLIYS
ncbi:hypothetical protein GLUCORHAEAF1_00105 [Komagataeibacter rhaeticus AF1]|nr:hypothetical protein GLUCORHAEAF1_00105 [Komagataeibacter rhaeticus AF1]